MKKTLFIITLAILLIVGLIGCSMDNGLSADYNKTNINQTTGKELVDEIKAKGYVLTQGFTIKEGEETSHSFKALNIPADGEVIVTGPQVTQNPSIPYKIIKPYLTFNTKDGKNFYLFPENGLTMEISNGSVIFYYVSAFKSDRGYEASVDVYYFKTK